MTFLDLSLYFALAISEYLMAFCIRELLRLNMKELIWHLLHFIPEIGGWKTLGRGQGAQKLEGREEDGPPWNKSFDAQS